MKFKLVTSWYSLNLDPQYLESRSVWMRTPSCTLLLAKGCSNIRGQSKQLSREPGLLHPAAATRNTNYNLLYHIGRLSLGGFAPWPSLAVCACESSIMIIMKQSVVVHLLVARFENSANGFQHSRPKASCKYHLGKDTKILDQYRGRSLIGIGGKTQYQITFLQVEEQNVPW